MDARRLILRRKFLEESFLSLAAVDEWRSKACCEDRTSTCLDFVQAWSLVDVSAGFGGGQS